MEPETKYDAQKVIETLQKALKPEPVDHGTIPADIRNMLIRKFNVDNEWTNSHHGILYFICTKCGCEMILDHWGTIKRNGRRFLAFELYPDDSTLSMVRIFAKTAGLVARPELISERWPGWAWRIVFHLPGDEQAAEPASGLFDFSMLFGMTTAQCELASVSKNEDPKAVSRMDWVRPNRN